MTQYAIDLFEQDDLFPYHIIFMYENKTTLYNIAVKYVVIHILGFVLQTKPKRNISKILQWLDFLSNPKKYETNLC